MLNIAQKRNIRLINEKLIPKKHFKYSTCITKNKYRKTFALKVLRTEVVF